MIDEINVKVTLASANVQLNLLNKGFRCLNKQLLIYFLKTSMVHIFCKQLN